jgi:hypothetical protein
MRVEYSKDRYSRPDQWVVDPEFFNSPKERGDQGGQTRRRNRDFSAFSAFPRALLTRL